MVLGATMSLSRVGVGPRAQGPRFAYPPGQAACGFLSVLGPTGHFLTSHPDGTPRQNTMRAEWCPRYDGGQREARGVQGRTGRSVTVAAKASSEEQGKDRPVLGE